MVKVLMVMAMLASHGASAASLSAQLDKTVVALGEPVSLSVQARGLSLDALDIAPLLVHFEVFARTLSRSAESETLVLTLYPRATGTVQIPALNLAALRTVALSLNVNDGSEAVPRVTANWTLDPALPRVNQPARLTLDICDDGSLQWQRPILFTSTGRLLRALGEEEGEGERAGEPCTLHQYYWSVIATQSNAASLNVPMLDASRFGQHLRFPGPAFSYQAMALPAWLPAQVPSVAPHIQADPLPVRWPLARPLAWHIQVTGGYSAAGLKALLELQLRDSPALGVYPPLIEPVALDDLTSPLSRYAVTVFMQPRVRGQLGVPDLHFPWFDAARGQLSSTVVKGKAVTVFDPRLQLAARVMGGVLALLMAVGLGWQIRRMVRWRLARRRGLRGIRQARDGAGLAQAVRQFSLTGQAAAPSLGEWVHRLRQEGVACEVKEVVSQLEQQQFGLVACSLGELKQNFLRALAPARPGTIFRGRR
ncbi:MAG: BatD family protein [Thiobacillus sp.]